jgi:hypothetical protein
VTGPFASPEEARAAPEVRAVYERMRGPAGAAGPLKLAMLTSACESAGVTLGAYDRRAVAWLAGWEPEIIAAIAGIIRRASGAGGEPGPAGESPPVPVPPDGAGDPVSRTAALLAAIVAVPDYPAPFAPPAEGDER